ncbi:hypothetical protein AB0R01_30355 [Streptomyces rochei]|uniref:hypothetical protein n=1 Tax=Streptomyces TaxID=1883 RepID=UPI0022EB2E38|nr:hypothetical protein [Streptomyces sp. DHE17-7]MBJ6623565.1 hypothetical protein [Streptomyces sp. DHE17-7]
MVATTEALASTMAEGPTSHTQNQAVRPANTFGYTREQQIEALYKLREPFKPEEIRYLPRVWCGACKNSRGQGCQNHRMTKCGKCGSRMPDGGHIDLRFVGHAEATNRLLNVDPFWDWEPLTVDERGLPTLDGYRGLWIRLTVCGMTRLGYGHAGDKTGGDAIKEIIGDAIRNAGMRFGMALDLWTSSDLEIIESGGASVDEGQEERAEQSAPGPGRELEKLKAKVNAGWNNVLSCEQNLAEARQKKLLDELVAVGEQQVRVEDLLSKRIATLKAAQGGDTERSAA